MAEPIKVAVSAQASGVLLKAANLLEERGRTYDRPDGGTSMDRAIVAFNAITGRDLTEADGWLLMQIVKDCRQWAKSGFHQDSAEDCIAFAALKAVAKQRDEQTR